MIDKTQVVKSIKQMLQSTDKGKKQSFGTGQKLSESKPSKRMGRPPKPLDFSKLELLLQMYPTKKYLATYFDCSEDHIENEIWRQYELTFSALRERAIESRKNDVINWAFKFAAQGNDSLIKFIMKNLHKWTDKIEIEPSEQQVFELRYQIYKKQKEASEAIDVEVKQIPERAVDEPEEK